MALKKKVNYQPLIPLDQLKIDIKKRDIVAKITDEQRFAARELVKSFHGDEVYSWKENQKRPTFIDNLFVKVLGYEKQENRQGESFSLLTEYKDATGTIPDGLLGMFDVDELQDPTTLKPVGFVEVEDASYSFGAKRTDKRKGMDQAFDYRSKFSYQTGVTQFEIVTNFVELRIYTHDKLHAHSIDLTNLTDDEVLSELLYFLAPANILPELFEKTEDLAPVVQVQQRVEDENRKGISISAGRASEMGELHDKFIKAGFKQHQADKMIVRLAFLMFCEDTDVIEMNLFKRYLSERVRAADPDNRMDRIHRLFQAVDTPDDSQRENLTKLSGFPYINGGLFKVSRDDFPEFADISDDIIDTIYEAAKQNWSKVNPIVFGSMYEGAMNTQIRHELGAHYTPEDDILKVINGLFMDDLRARFLAIVKGGANVISKLLDFKRQLSHLHFLDPACGSGNFLIVSYRELRSGLKSIFETGFKRHSEPRLPSTAQINH
ncbi:SAM-dependent DNA methyltransferase [Levilactobacillus lindianensis]|uniref:SAM-dependent DNA methyltransferase n=1 Tax=Levilactobacillus lindianensis TaxID=2486018 RepID=UPI0013DDAE39|nr:SAM-dependent DNA methyltransferase [Levilactobacillus lindianensis]